MYKHKVNMDNLKIKKVKVMKKVKRNLIMIFTRKPQNKRNIFPKTRKQLSLLNQFVLLLNLRICFNGIYKILMEPV